MAYNFVKLVTITSSYACTCFVFICLNANATHTGVRVSIGSRRSTKEFHLALGYVDDDDIGPLSAIISNAATVINIEPKHTHTHKTRRHLILHTPDFGFCFVSASSHVANTSLKYCGLLFAKWAVGDAHADTMERLAN